MRPATSRATASFSSSLENCSRPTEVPTGYDQMNRNALCLEAQAGPTKIDLGRRRADSKYKNAKGRAVYRFIECTVEKYMTRASKDYHPPLCSRNTISILEEGKMFGIVTKFDFLRAFAFTTGQMLPNSITSC